MTVSIGAIIYCMYKNIQNTKLPSAHYKKTNTSTKVKNSLLSGSALFYVDIKSDGKDQQQITKSNQPTQTHTGRQRVLLYM